MITRPLELQSRLSPPPRDLDFVAWVNVAVIALFFSLLGSRFVLAPGLLVDGNFELPSAPGLQLSETSSVVVKYRQDGVILFGDSIVKLSELQQHLEAYAKQHPGEVLLLVADKHVSMQAATDLAAMVQSVGFKYVLVAGKQSAPRKPLP